MGLKDITSSVYVGVLVHNCTILFLPTLLPYCKSTLEENYIFNSESIFSTPLLLKIIK